jgi:hypothetical protein
MGEAHSMPPWRRASSPNSDSSAKVFVAGYQPAARWQPTWPPLPGRLFSRGIHSGLPYRSAFDVVSALAAMRGQLSSAFQHNGGDGIAVPAIVFIARRTTSYIPPTVQRSSLLIPAMGKFQAERLQKGMVDHISG